MSDKISSKQKQNLQTPRQALFPYHKKNSHKNSSSINENLILKTFPQVREDTLNIFKVEGRAVNSLTRLIPLATLSSVLSACNSGESSDSISPLNITAVKAPLDGALSFVDRNGDGLYTPGEEKAITASDGTATINLLSPVSDSVKVVISSIKAGEVIDGITYSKGTVDTATGDIIEDLTLKAPANFAVVTPVTTVIAQTGLSEDKVKQVLGLPDNMDIKNFNPFKENKTAEEELIALEAEKVALKLHTTVSTIQSSILGSGLDANEAFSTAIEAVSEVIKSQSTAGQKADLSDISIIDEIVTTTSSKMNQKLIVKGLDATDIATNIKTVNAILIGAKTQIKNINVMTDSIDTFDENKLGDIAKLADKSKKEAAEAIAAEQASPGSGNSKFTLTAAKELIQQEASSATVEQADSSSSSSSDDTTSSSSSSSDDKTSSSNSSSKLKILVLHGGGETSTSFQGQGGVISLMNNLSDYEFVFADAPKNNVWMQDPPGGKGKATSDPNWADDSISYLDNLVTQHGPFFGILGYSQGAAFIPVYLANTSSTFKIALMYNGYLPTTHQGLISTINSAAPFQIPSVIFSGEYDYYFKDLAQGLSDTFSNSLDIRSSAAGHHLPFESDPTFTKILNFITTNQSSIVSTNSGSLTYASETGKNIFDLDISKDHKPYTIELKSSDSKGDLILYKKDTNPSSPDKYDYVLLDIKNGKMTIHIEDNPLLQNLQISSDSFQGNIGSSRKQYSVSFTSKNSEDKDYGKEYSDYTWIDADSMAATEKFGSYKQITIKDENIKSLDLDNNYDYINFGLSLDNGFLVEDFMISTAIT